MLRLCHLARRYHQSRRIYSLRHAATKVIADHGGKPLARGGRSEALEGKARARNVVLEFESYDAARRYFYSEQYQAARALREGAADIEMLLVEGV
jgi:uncharacterized protein (DUF1330 family)